MLFGTEYRLLIITRGVKLYTFYGIYTGDTKITGVIPNNGSYKTIYFKDSMCNSDILKDDMYYVGAVVGIQHRFLLPNKYFIVGNFEKYGYLLPKDDIAFIDNNRSLFYNKKS